jgi:hypothetical protein
LRSLLLFPGNLLLLLLILTGKLLWWHETRPKVLHHSLLLECCLWIIHSWVLHWHLLGLAVGAEIHHIGIVKLLIWRWLPHHSVWCLDEVLRLKVREIMRPISFLMTLILCVFLTRLEVKYFLWDRTHINLLRMLNKLRILWLRLLRFLRHH